MTAPLSLQSIAVSASTVLTWIEAFSASPKLLLRSSCERYVSTYSSFVCVIWKLSYIIINMVIFLLNLQSDSEPTWRISLVCYVLQSIYNLSAKFASGFLLLFHFCIFFHETISTVPTLRKSGIELLQKEIQLLPVSGASLSYSCM